jgi:hypothetical protein
MKKRIYLFILLVVMAMMMVVTTAQGYEPEHEAYPAPLMAPTANPYPANDGWLNPTPKVRPAKKFRPFVGFPPWYTPGP